MSQQVERLDKLLLRFKVKIGETTASLCRQAFEAMQLGKLSEAISLAQAALRDGTTRNDRRTQAVACAYLAAAYAHQQNFVEATRQAEDCHRLFKQTGSLRNRTLAKALLASIIHMQIETLSNLLLDTLEMGQRDANELKAKALRKGDVIQATLFHNQLTEFTNSLRRTRWIPAISHALPLIWIPVIDELSADPRVGSPQVSGHMEPVVTVTHELESTGYPALSLFMFNRGSNDQDLNELVPGRITRQLFAAYMLPRVGGLDSAPLMPASLNPDAVYVAVKIDAESAKLGGYRDGDYLLIRNLSSAELEKAIEKGDDVTGWIFEFGEDGKIRFFTAVPPKFVGEPHVKMFDVQIDAILRRIP